MIKKLNKYIDFLQRISSQNKIIAELKSHNNSTLNTILDTIFQVKNSKFSNEDLKIFNEIESYRNNLSQSTQVITYEIFGSDSTAKVKFISKQAASPEIWAKFHYALAKNLKAKNYLEIGTNLGVSCSYIISALKENDDFNFVTMEGIQALCEISQKQFSTLTDEKNFKIIQGLYENTFPQVLDLPFDFDVIFIDGNHQKSPTLHYFESLKSKINSPAVVVFDDINWSEEMKEVWAIIKNDSIVNYAIDLYKLGIVLIDKNDINKNISKNLFLTMQ
ncbi:O-methyltransferase [Moheibacter sediminis]|uniref:Methyltransferase domain-containing protein n=1 Tax=Moheibacter sediminis TaxID=1434700 RepID=A0A1W1Z9X8_9FLAO|nr:class I SAM-dependent methyltransferase [Moheibacter sediminis]SMC45230.1 Methyltransferase domain-containing protein [Moheibacter sediminis]